MQSPFKKILLAMLLLALGAALLLNLLNSEFKPAEVLPPKIVKADSDYHYTPPKIISKKAEPETNSESDAPAEKISRAEVDAWLAKHNRNAMSLLAAFRALNDTNLLNEAATNFPDDPHVELAVLARDEFPEERRKWLDLFKQSSPSNSLANYFSAQDDFKNGKKDEATQELLAASKKSQFDSYATETQLDSEQLYAESGKSPIEIATLGMGDWAGENMFEMATLKRLGQGTADLEKQYINSGDPDSAVNLARIGMTLGNQIQSGDSGKYLINQLVGVAEESIVLSKLDQNTSYDFLDGQTPAQVILNNRQQKQAEVQIMQNWNGIYPQMSPDEMVNYSERIKIYGELPAMQWVIQQHPPKNSPP